MTSATAVLVISDAGAARRQFDITRLLDSVALIKALRADSAGVAWLNPVPGTGGVARRQGRWHGTFRCSPSTARAYTRLSMSCAGVRDRGAAGMSVAPPGFLRWSRSWRRRGGSRARRRARRGGIAAGLPRGCALVVDAELLNLLRVNFFLDPPHALAYEVEADLLLSPLFRELGEDLFELEPGLCNSCSRACKGSTEPSGCSRSPSCWSYTPTRRPRGTHSLNWRWRSD